MKYRQNRLLCWHVLVLIKCEMLTFYCEIFISASENHWHVLESAIFAKTPNSARTANLVTMSLLKFVQPLFLLAIYDGDYVAVRFESMWLPCKIISLWDDGYLKVSRMKYADDYDRHNKFRWGREDIRTCHKADILVNIKEPMPEGSRKGLLSYKLHDNDFGDASYVLQLVM